MIDRGGAGEATGRRLLRLSKRMFRWWHRVRDGSIDRQRFQRIAARLRREVKAALEGGLSCGCAKTAATCFEILKVEEGLWTFVRVAGVEPTNNAPERRVAPCGDLAADQRGDGQCRGQPVRRTDVDGGRDLPPAKAECAGLPQFVLRRAFARSKGPVLAACKVTSYRDC